MPESTKITFLREFSSRFGTLRKLGKSQSLYQVGNDAARLYIRYSKVHSRNQTFYGLRKEDLQQLEGHPSIVCLLWNDQPEPLALPYSEYEEIFKTISPASDGQYKAQVYLQNEGNELYIANAGRHNVESYFGWDHLASLIETTRLTENPALSHAQVQTLIGAIGLSKGFDVWIPRNDRGKLDWSLTKQFECAAALPEKFNSIENILSEIDILWMERGAGKLRSLFEVEHSTPIYSGLLRFNDVHLVTADAQATYNIVSNNERRNLFANQLNRPTFKASGLDRRCTFMNYSNVFVWHEQVNKTEQRRGYG